MAKKEGNPPPPPHLPTDYFRSIPVFSAVRDMGEPTGYIYHEGQEPRRAPGIYNSLNMDTGDSPFLGPIQAAQAVRDFARLSPSEMLSEMKSYSSDPFGQQLEIPIRERFNLRSKFDEGPEIYVSGSGSDQILVDLFRILPSENATVIGLGAGHFPLVVNVVKDLGEYPGASLAQRGLRQSQIPGTDATLITPPETEKFKIPYQTINVPIDVTWDECINRSLEALAHFPGPRILYASPGTPNGELMSVSTQYKLLAFAKSHGDIVIMDEAYGDFAPDSQSAIRWTQEKDFDNTLVVVRTYSKGLGLAGMRIAYAVLSPVLGEKFRRRTLPYRMDLFQTKIFKAVTKPDVITPYLEQVRRQTQEIKQLIIDGITKTRPEGVFSVMPTTLTNPIMLIKGPQQTHTMFAYSGVNTTDATGFGETHPDLKSGRYVRARIPPTRIEAHRFIRVVRTIAQKYRSQ